MPQKVLVLGATTNSARYAYMAAELLTVKGYEVVPVGVRKGELFGKTIINTKIVIPEIDTITLYIGPKIQEEWEEYIIETQPQRVIFNPGTENTALQTKLKNAGIETENACTLVMLRTGRF